MSYKEIKGNLFASNAMALVNTVNCIGDMGKGIALEFKLRYPVMFQKYHVDCKAKRLKPGGVFTYPQKNGPLILNFAIKDDWHQPSKVEWVESSLAQFAAHYKVRQVTSIAFPWMGAENGGIDLSIIKQLTRKYLQNLEDIEIEVYDYDPKAREPLFDKLTLIAAKDAAPVDLYSAVKKRLIPLGIDLKIKERQFSKMLELVRGEKIFNLVSFLRVDGIGSTTVTDLYQVLTALSVQDISNLHVQSGLI